MKTHREIVEMLDNSPNIKKEAGEEKQTKKKKRLYSLRMSKPLAIGIAFLVVVGVFGLGNLLVSYVTIDGEHTIDSLWQFRESSTGNYSGWVDAEDYTFTYDTANLTAGDSLMFRCNFQLSSDADGNRTLYFHITDDSVNGVNCSIVDDSALLNPIDSITVEPGSNVVCYYRLEIDPMTPAGVYEVTVDFNGVAL